MPLSSPWAPPPIFNSGQRARVPSSAKEGLRNLQAVPQWFVNLLTMPDIDAASPVLIDGRHVGDIVFLPDLSADLFEKWIGFLA